MDKFQRNYRLHVEGADGKEYVFEYPITLEFYIDKRAFHSAGTGSFRLHNLSADTRKILYKDISDVVGPASKRLVTFMAGYGKDLSLVFYGNIKEAKSYREEGSTSFITEIDCYVWSFAMVNVRSEWTLNSPQYSLPLKRSTVIEKILQDLIPSGVHRGIVNSISFDIGSAPYSRPYIAYDNSWNLLKEETNDHCFIDNGAVNCLLDDDTYIGNILLIDSSTGLLSTPKKCESMLKIDILFEPSIQLGQKIELLSQSESLYNGEYKVIGIQHAGIISGAVGGKCKTTLLLNAGKFILNVISGSMSNQPVSLS